MLSDLKLYIEKHDLCKPDDKLLVAVSGGIDSVVLLDLLCRASYTCAIAHCNFNLRGEESDRDEEFVKELGKKYDIIAHTVSFDTKGYARKKGISTQMAARRLRYEWFDEIAENHGYNCIAIAHNADDNIETFHLNLARGTGLSGIKGISPKSGKVIRPLLWAFRDNIVDYCRSHGLEYREDSSNIETGYKRNYLRHEILPRFSRLNPSYKETLLRSQEYLNQSSNILDFFYQILVNEIVSYENDQILINIPKLLELPEPSWFIFRYLSGFGFNSSQISDIALSLKADSGKKFQAGDHLLVKDRDSLIISKMPEDYNQKYYLEEYEKSIERPVGLSWESIPANDYRITDNNNIAALDADKIEFPLILRTWQEGDYFYPLGMENPKKLSDFFIDLKIPLPEKKRKWIITTGNRIIWVVGHRIDNRFKITPDTKTILKIAKL